MARKHRGKRRNCSLRAISPFLTVFSKDLYWRHLKTRACLGKGLKRKTQNEQFHLFHDVFYAICILKSFNSHILVVIFSFFEFGKSQNGAWGNVLSPFLPEHVCSTSLLKTLQKKEKLLVMSNLSFSYCVFYQFGGLSVTFIKFEIVVCKFF